MTQKKKKAESEIEIARKLPSSENVECELISACLYGHRDSSVIIDLLREDHFVRHEYRMIFSTIKKLHEAGKPTDCVSVSEAMEKKDLNEIGGLKFLGLISGEMYSAYNVTNACRILCDKARQRQLIYVLEKLQLDAWDSPEDIDTTVERALSEITQVAHDASASFDDPSDFDAGLNMLAALDNPSTIRIVTGIKTVDEVTGGFRAGELVVLTAETGTGKTLLASQIKRHSCMREQHSIFCNGEMLAEHLRAREVSVRSHVRYEKFRNPERLNEFERQAIVRVVGEGCQKCRIMDGDLSLARIRSRTRKYFSKGEISLLIVDYDELVEAPGKDEWAEQKELIRSLKSLALELKIPVILISQLRKALQNEDRSKPTISRLYGSGSKVKTASIILYVDRPFVRELEGDETEARVVVVKNRDGKVGSVPCTFNLSTLEFEEETEKQSEKLPYSDR